LGIERWRKEALDLGFVIRTNDRHWLWRCRDINSAILGVYFGRRARVFEDSRVVRMEDGNCGLESLRERMVINSRSSSGKGALDVFDVVGDGSRFRRDFRIRLFLIFCNCSVLSSYE